MVFNSSRFGLVTALALALFSAGCLDKEVQSANDDCSNTYVGRQKAACQTGVTVAYNTARTSDGKSRKAKYKSAVARCQKFEKPLIKACVDGVNNFKTEIANLDSSSGRSPASN